MIQVVVSRKLCTKLVFSFYVHVAANPSLAATKSSFGYRDIKILGVRQDAFLILERMVSLD
jgi:hypothetical protein